jgi:hypothetical protein
MQFPIFLPVANSKDEAGKTDQGLSAMIKSLRFNMVAKSETVDEEFSRATPLPSHTCSQ